jgi:hypothetical protein
MDILPAIKKIMPPEINRILLIFEGKYISEGLSGFMKIYTLSSTSGYP